MSKDITMRTGEFRVTAFGAVTAAVLTIVLASGSARAQIWKPFENMDYSVPGNSNSTTSSSWSWGATPTSGRKSVKLQSKYRPGTIIVSFGDRRIYKIKSSTLATSYPIAIPKGEAKWSGIQRVSRKVVNPKWTPTALMRKENPKLPEFVAGGDKRNPLGVRALYLGSTLYRIHGTDAPWLIGKAVSKGCIRMYNKDAIHLYDRTSVGTKVIVTWDKFKAIPG